jgi:hypothetical protein
MILADFVQLSECHVISDHPVFTFLLFICVLNQITIFMKLGVNIMPLEANTGLVLLFISFFFVYLMMLLVAENV